MGFKFKHIIKAPVKIGNKIGQTGVLGQRNDNFRVLGIKIGKDLVPVVQTAAIVLMSPVLGPVLSSSTVTALSGGNESDVLKSATISTVGQIVGGTLGVSPDICPIIVPIINNTVSNIILHKPITANLLAVTLSNAIFPTNQFARATLQMSIDRDIRMGLQNIGSCLVSNYINSFNRTSNQTIYDDLLDSFDQQIENIESNDNKEELKEISKNYRERKVTKKWKAIPRKNLEKESNEPRPKINWKDIGNNISNEKDIKSTETVFTLNSKKTGATINLDSSNMPIKPIIQTDGGIGITNDKSSFFINRSDIYRNGFKFTVDQNTNREETFNYMNDIGTKENIGTCISTRETISVQAPANISTSNEIHVNNNCALFGVGLVAATIAIPEVTIPILATSLINK